MLENVKGFADERNGVAVSKDSARKANIINFKIIETGEDYDVLAGRQRYQLTFYKALNNKVTFQCRKNKKIRKILDNKNEKHDIISKVVKNNRNNKEEYPLSP